MRLSIQDFLRKINSLALSVVSLRDIVFFSVFSFLFFLYAVILLVVSLPERHTFVVTHDHYRKEDKNNKFFYVASKTGKKYYRTSCSFVRRIKEENRVYFLTEEDAVRSGRDKSTVCE